MSFWLCLFQDQPKLLTLEKLFCDQLSWCPPSTSSLLHPGGPNCCSPISSAGCSLFPKPCLHLQPENKWIPLWVTVEGTRNIQSSRSKLQLHHGTYRNYLWKLPLLWSMQGNKPFPPEIKTCTRAVGAEQLMPSNLLVYKAVAPSPHGCALSTL